jgi:RNA polymerase sigma-70 factor (sigma-E family)
VTGFDEFVNTRGPALLRFAYLLTGNAHQAEDLVQEALARSHPRWDRVERYEVPEAYVRKAVLRQYLSWRRRRSSTEVVVATMHDSMAVSMDETDRIVVREQLWQLLVQLPRMQRAVLVLRYFEDRDDDDIAGLLGCARATVRVHAARGLQRLRAVLPSTGFPLEV